MKKGFAPLEILEIHSKDLQYGLSLLMQKLRLKVQDL